MPKAKKGTKRKGQGPRRIGFASGPLKVRGVRIYFAERIDPADLESSGFNSVFDLPIAIAKNLLRGDVLIHNGLMVRPGRRGRWVYQTDNGVWNEVRFLEEIPREGMMTSEQLEALFKMQGFAMGPGLLDQLFVDAPRVVITREGDDSDYVDLRLCIEGMPWRRPASRVILVAWREYIVVKLGGHYGICRNDGSPIRWSQSAKQIADWGITNRL